METLKTDVSSLSQRVSKVSSQVAIAEAEIKSQMQDFLLVRIDLDTKRFQHSII